MGRAPIELIRDVPMVHTAGMVKSFWVSWKREYRCGSSYIPGRSLQSIRRSSRSSDIACC